MSSNEIFSCNYSWLKTTKCDIANSESEKFNKPRWRSQDLQEVSYYKWKVSSTIKVQYSHIEDWKIRHRLKLFLTCEIIVRESWSSQALETLICELSERQRRSLLSNNNSIHFLEHNEKKFPFPILFHIRHPLRSHFNSHRNQSSIHHTRHTKNISNSMQSESIN